ncbi:hypothetical protein HPB50_001901 [Hyalomma asiaticum]|uniref:Uncharacterized protein n=1 Tax=Hyalomma asiaticum TaxID=266040 RepID=A0ACB7TB82_HYAAI|nr:hypothetical protein HPB50_001901 [Hyalomma asiaticum]
MTCDADRNSSRVRLKTQAGRTTRPSWHNHCQIHLVKRRYMMKQYFVRGNEITFKLACCFELGVQMFRPGPNSASSAFTVTRHRFFSLERRKWPSTEGALMSPGAAAFDGMSVLAGRMDGSNKRCSNAPRP